MLKVRKQYLFKNKVRNRALFKTPEYVTEWIV